MKKLELMAFTYNQLGLLRTFKDEKEEAWFALKDICLILEISNVSQLKKRLAEKGICSKDVATLNQFGSEAIQKMVFINEANLYRSLFQSRKAEAVRFQDWVTDVVLPQIRRTGGYIPINKDDDEKEELKKTLEILQRTKEWQEEQLKMQGYQLSAQMPLVEFAEAVRESDDCCTVAQLAKLLYDNGVHLGQNQLFEALRELGYLCNSAHHWNEPYQKWVKRGYFKVKLSNPWIDHSGETHYWATTLVTGKGQMKLIELFKQLFIPPVLYQATEKCA